MWRTHFRDILNDGILRAVTIHETGICKMENPKRADGNSLSWLTIDEHREKTETALLGILNSNGIAIRERQAAAWFCQCLRVATEQPQKLEELGNTLCELIRNGETPEAAHSRLRDIECGISSLRRGAVAAWAGGALWHPIRDAAAEAAWKKLYEGSGEIAVLKDGVKVGTVKGLSAGVGKTEQAINNLYANAELTPGPSVTRALTAGGSWMEWRQGVEPEKTCLYPADSIQVECAYEDDGNGESKLVDAKCKINGEPEIKVIGTGKVSYRGLHAAARIVATGDAMGLQIIDDGKPAAGPWTQPGYCHIGKPLAELATVASEPPKECICSGNQLLFGECNCGWKAAQK